MNKTNYQQKMQEQIKLLNGNKAKLLIHSCCAPCSSACLERLYNFFDVSVLFYNPNIQTGEYEKRKAEQIRFLEQTGWAKFIDCDHNEEDFYLNICGLEGEPEGGKRCERCFEIRLKKTAEIARQMHFDFFATTLTLSPLKNADIINALGEDIARQVGVNWLYSDFKKQNGYLRSIELSKIYQLYRQNFCGCAFSEKESFIKGLKN